MFIKKKFLIFFSIFFLLTTNIFALTNDEKVTRAFNYLVSWTVKFSDRGGESDFLFDPEDFTFDECFEQQTELISLNSVDINDLSTDRYDVFLYLTENSADNPINFILIAAAFNDMCSKYFGSTKDG